MQINMENVRYQVSKWRTKTWPNVYVDMIRDGGLSTTKIKNNICFVPEFYITCIVTNLTEDKIIKKIIDRENTLLTFLKNAMLPESTIYFSYRPQGWNINTSDMHDMATLCVAIYSSDGLALSKDGTELISITGNNKRVMKHLRDDKDFIDSVKESKKQTSDFSPTYDRKETDISFITNAMKSLLDMRKEYAPENGPLRRDFNEVWVNLLKLKDHLENS